MKFQILAKQKRVYQRVHVVLRYSDLFVRLKKCTLNIHWKLCGRNHIRRCSCYKVSSVSEIWFSCRDVVHQNLPLKKRSGMSFSLLVRKLVYSICKQLNIQTHIKYPQAPHKHSVIKFHIACELLTS